MSVWLIESHQYFLLLKERREKIPRGCEKNRIIVINIKIIINATLRHQAFFGRVVYDTLYLCVCVCTSFPYLIIDCISIVIDCISLIINCISLMHARSLACTQAQTNKQTHK
jgi:hypothetical protein